MIERRTEVVIELESKFSQALRDDVVRGRRFPDTIRMNGTSSSGQRLHDRGQRLQEPQGNGNYRRGATQLLPDNLNQITNGFSFGLDVVEKQVRVGTGHGKFEAVQQTLDITVALTQVRGSGEEEVTTLHRPDHS